MRLSISLSDDDVATLDRYVKAAGLASRSAAIQRAMRLLGDPTWRRRRRPRGTRGGVGRCCRAGHDLR